MSPAGRPSPGPPRSAVTHVMGTVVSLAAPAAVGAEAFRAATREAFGELRRMDEVFSPYRPDSPVSRIRDGRLRIADLPGHPEGPLLTEVLRLCERLYADSGGAFDAWAVGDPPGFDPCGAVKGWAAERAAGLLARRLPAFALNAGGDVRVRGGWGGGPWRVGVTDPHRPGGVLAVLPLSDAAVATSGTAERGRHVWHPGTGRPAAGLAQVTVVGPDLALADGYATAAMARAATAAEVDDAHAWLEALARRDGYWSLTVDPAGRVRRLDGLDGRDGPGTPRAAAPAAASSGPDGG
ncbi:FAD:protein FMN transferase [Streptantibioticus parmotrematis]|uniref:FAD:protein FMN transferase n=1 Tax=Streptantibioticus parmotrematis TaxID=2873249 RepID=UPI0033F93335